MELIIERKILSEALSRLSHTVSKVGIMPVIGNVLVRVTDDDVLLVTTDLSSTGLQSIPLIRTDDWRDSTLPFRELNTFVNMQSGDEIKMKQKDNGDVVVTCGRPRMTLKTLPVVEFPALPDFDEIALHPLLTTDLLNGIQSVIGCTDPKAHVTMQNGVWFEVGNRVLSMAGMSTAVVGGAEFAIDSDLSFSLMVRSDVLQRMMSALPESTTVEFGFDANRIYVQAGDYRFVGQRVSLDKYVDWRGFYAPVFAEGPKCTVLLEDGSRIVAALKQIESLFSVSGYTPVNCSTDGNVVRLTKESSDVVTDFDIQFEADVTGEMDVRFDIRMAKAIFSNCNAPTTVKFFDMKQPLQIVSENKTYVFVLFVPEK